MQRPERMLWMRPAWNQISNDRNDSTPARCLPACLPAALASSSNTVKITGGEPAEFIDPPPRLIRYRCAWMYTRVYNGCVHRDVIVFKRCTVDSWEILQRLKAIDCSATKLLALKRRRKFIFSLFKSWKFLDGSIVRLIRAHLIGLNCFRQLLAAR